MNLHLRNGYPFPYPKDLTEERQAELSYAAPSNTYFLPGVKSIEVKYTVTVEFKTQEAYDRAQAATGWDRWDAPALILEAQHSVADGYDFPAIIVGDTAYCGWHLEEA